MNTKAVCIERGTMDCQGSGPEDPVEYEIWQKSVEFDGATNAAVEKRFIHSLAALRDKRALVVGCGSIGNAVAADLAYTGCSDITFVDFDRVETHNLPRSALFREEDVGQPKAKALARRTAETSPFSIKCTGIVADVTRLGYGFLGQFDILMSPVDSWSIRAYVSRGAKLLGKHHVSSGTGVSGGGDRRGMGTTVTVEEAGSAACYECMCYGTLSEEEKKLSCINYSPETQPQVMSFSAVAAGLACSCATRLMTTGFHVNERTKDGRPKQWKYVLVEPGLYPDTDGISQVRPRSVTDRLCAFHGMLASAEETKIRELTLKRGCTVKDLYEGLGSAIGIEQPEYVLDIRSSFLLFMQFPEQDLRKRSGLLPVSEFLVDDRENDQIDTQTISRLPADHIYTVRAPVGLTEKTWLVRIMFGGE